MSKAVKDQLEVKEGGIFQTRGFESAFLAKDSHTRRNPYYRRFSLRKESSLLRTK
jgi:hypothetical protein